MMAVSSSPDSQAQPPESGEGPTISEQPAEPESLRTPADAAIVVKGAGKRFGDTWVVRNLDFSVERGTIFGLFGPSGSGKTTTIRLLLGLFGLDEGEITVLDTPPRRFRRRTRARIGYMPQLFVLYPELSVMENLELVASLYGMGWLRRRKPMRNVLEFVELWEHRRKTAEQLSGGMKRRLELATALVHGPDLIVVDEPTAGVDPILRAKFWEHFRALRDEGRTIFVTSQYVTEAEYCDRLAVLGKGQMAAIGTPEELRHQVMGGEVVHVVADGLDRQRIEQIEALDVVRNVERVSYEELRISVDEANQAIPVILSALNESGIEVRTIEEYRPNFDEVFVQLMEQSDVESVE